MSGKQAKRDRKLCRRLEALGHSFASTVDVTGLDPRTVARALGWVWRRVRVHHKGGIARCQAYANPSGPAHPYVTQFERWVHPAQGPVDPCELVGRQMPLVTA